MTVTALTKDLDALTLTLTAEFDAGVERVWQVWADPRQLERWWGPPTYPATVVDHDLRPGGRVTYYMTGPDGDRPHGWWQIRSVEPPHRLEFDDGFADEDFNPNPDLPTMSIVVTLSDLAGRTRMDVVSTFASEAAMAQVVEMGMEEGIRQAAGQIDDILNEVAPAR